MHLLALGTFSLSSSLCTRTTSSRLNAPFGAAAFSLDKSSAGKTETDMS